MKVSKGQSQPSIAAAAFLILYMVMGRQFEYRVLIVAHVAFDRRSSPPAARRMSSAIVLTLSSAPEFRSEFVKSRQVSLRIPLAVCYQGLKIRFGQI